MALRHGRKGSSARWRLPRRRIGRQRTHERTGASAALRGPSEATRNSTGPAHTESDAKGITAAAWLRRRDRDALLFPGVLSRIAGRKTG